MSIFVKGKKKISITGKKAKHKYTFTSKKKKIAKVSKTGVITGVKAGKTTITVKDTWKQKGKKKTKKLGTINVTVKKKTTPKVTPNVPQVTPQPPAPATQDPNGGGSQPPVPTPDNGGDQPGEPTPTLSGKPDDPTEDQRNGIVTGIAAGEVEITVKIKKGDNVIKEETIKMEVRFSYKGTPIDIDLTKGEAIEGGSVTKNQDGSVLIMNEPGAVVCALPYALKKGEKIKVIMEGHFGDNTGGFRMWTAPDPSTVGGNKVQAGSTVNYELNTGKPDFNPGNDFSVTAELEASVECVNLVLRMPGWSGPVTQVTDLTFTKFAVEYI